MESGASITIADAMKYLSLDISVPPLKPAAESKPKKEETEGEEHGEDDPDEDKGDEPEPDEVDDPGLPKVRKTKFK
mgnify:CR=1 FL=1